MSGMWTEIEFIDPSVPAPSADVAAGARDRIADAMIAAFEHVWCANAEDDPASVADDGGEFSVSRTDEGFIRIALEGNTKYEISGDLNALEAISQSWPSATITILREWTGDGGPATERFEFFNGERIREQQSELVDVNPPTPLGHDVDVTDHADSGGAWVHVEIPSDPDEHGRSHTLALAEITPTEARALSASLLKAANGAEFHYARLEKEQADA